MEVCKQFYMLGLFIQKTKTSNKNKQETKGKTVESNETNICTEKQRQANTSNEKLGKAHRIRKEKQGTQMRKQGNVLDITRKAKNRDGTQLRNTF